MPHINLWESSYFAKVPDGPQTYTLDVLWLQEEGAQIHMSVWSRRFTLTKNEGRGSAPHLLHNGLSDSPIWWRCLLRVLCPVRRAVTALDCVLLKDRNLALVQRQGPKINFRALSSGVTKTSAPYPMLVNQPTSNPSSYILPRDSQSQLRSDKL